MSKWIEADEILKHKCDVYDINNHVLHAVPTGHILSAPTIDIVTCEECKHWRTDEKVRCRLLPYADANDYCSYGERSEV